MFSFWTRVEPVQGLSGGGTDRAGHALQVDMQPRDKKGAGHAQILAQAGLCNPSRTLVRMPAARTPLLTTRRHVDLQRVSSAICSLG